MVWYGENHTTKFSNNLDNQLFNLKDEIRKKVSVYVSIWWGEITLVALTSSGPSLEVNPIESEIRLLVCLCTFRKCIHIIFFALLLILFSVFLFSKRIKQLPETKQVKLRTQDNLLHHTYPYAVFYVFSCPYGATKLCH